MSVFKKFFKCHKQQKAGKTNICFGRIKVMREYIIEKEVFHKYYEILPTRHCLYSSQVEGPKSSKQLELQKNFSKTTTIRVTTYIYQIHPYIIFNVKQNTVLQIFYSVSVTMPNNLCMSRTILTFSLLSLFTVNGVNHERLKNRLSTLNTRDKNDTYCPIIYGAFDLKKFSAISLILAEI